MNVTTKHTSERQTDRGQVGIGTLIVFIAMVLVAAIAAGVLVNTAGFLQEKSQQTGQESTNQVVNRIDTISTVGISDGTDITSINLLVKRTGGAGDIDLQSTSLIVTGEDGVSSTDLTNGAVSLSEEVGSSGANVLTADSDRVKITIDITSLTNDHTLSPNEQATIKLTTPSGATTTIVVQAPDPMPASGTAVSL